MTPMQEIEKNIDFYLCLY